MQVPAEAPTREQLEELLSRVPCDGQLQCCTHASAPADTVCSACGELHCWSCMTVVPRSGRLLCSACRSSLPPIGRHSFLRTWLREPVVYVLAAVVAATAAYFAGIGNPNSEALRRADATKPWYERQAGRMWMLQADRAQSRALTLASRGETQEAQKWFHLARAAFHGAGNAWRGTPVEADLRVAEAMLWLKLGDPRRTFMELIDLEDIIHPDHRLWCHYLYFRGKAALELGKTRLAEEHWRILLATIERAEKEPQHVFNMMLGELSEASQSDPVALLLQRRVREVCNTGTSFAKLKFTVLMEIEVHGLTVPTGILGPPAEKKGD